ncbi:MAG: hypothetical protein SPK71_04870, partial [Prevotella sp.]|nr:hypothetical protein [Prevotella sp.]
TCSASILQHFPCQKFSSFSALRQNSVHFGTLFAATSSITKNIPNIFVYEKQNHYSPTHLMTETCRRQNYLSISEVTISCHRVSGNNIQINVGDIADKSAC